MKKYFLFVLLFFFCFSSPVLSAEVPEENLKVKMAPELKIDLTSALKPMFVKHQGYIKLMVGIFAVFELFINPYLENLHELSLNERKELKQADRYLERKRRQWDLEDVREQRKADEERWRREDDEFWGRNYDY